RCYRDWSSDVCSCDLVAVMQGRGGRERGPRVIEVRGTVKSATAEKLTLDLGGRGEALEKTFDLTEKTKIVIDGKPGKAADLAQEIGRASCRESGQSDM